MIRVDLTQIELRMAAHIVGHAIARYDALTGGDITHDAEARPVVAGELATALQINFDQAAELLADALARRATNKLKRCALCDAPNTNARATCDPCVTAGKLD